MINIISTNDNPYFVGLGVPQDKGYVYVERDADTIVCEKLEKGELVFIFNARKAGKSSLRENVMKKLKLKGYKCLFFDISKFENSTTETGFYRSFMKSIIDELKIENLEFDQWFNQQQENDYPNTIILGFLFDYLLSELAGKIIIFMDEIDSFKRFKSFSTEGFFSWLRSLYDPQQRIKYSGLNFCLLGVAKVSELIDNDETTSFNFGEPIELTYFQLSSEGKIPESLKILNTPQLRELVLNPDDVLKTVLAKTGGQPYLTMKLLHTIVEFKKKIKEGDEETIISDLVKKHITNKNDDKWDEHDYFGYIERRIIRQKKGTKELENEKNTSLLLSLYQRILKGEKIQWNRESDTQLDLYLSGLVSKKQGLLKPVSPIHEEIFNLAWINECSNKIRDPRYQEKKTGWEKSNSDPSKRDRACLLYGDELIEAEQKYNKLSSEDEAFIHTSSKYYEQDVGGLRDTRLENLNDYQKKKIIDRLRYWTNYDKEIFNYLISIINHNYDNNLLVTTENDCTDNLDELVNNLVETKIIKCWHEIDTLSRFDDQIKTQEENNFFSMLVVYGQILHQGKVSFSETDQHQMFLLKIGLVKKRYSIEDGYYIEVSNPILVHTFDKNYINEMLPDRRGYGKKLGMWLITQDDQYLLSAEELETIIHSLAGESLHEEDHRFLIRSQISANSV